MDLPLILFVVLFLITGSSLPVLWLFKTTLLYAVIPPLMLLVIVYVVVPMVFRLSEQIQRDFVYQHKQKLTSTNCDLSDPTNFGIVGSRNISLPMREGHYIGLWQILPQSLVHSSHGKKPNDEFWNSVLKSSPNHIILYFHGNTGTRALDHRKELYWALQNHDYHVIAFDYRGFGDSSSIEISEETTVEDGLFVYNWLSRLLQGSMFKIGIIVWGHSLGTGIASSTVAKLCQAENPPKGLILESAFTNIGEAMRLHRKAKLYRALPNFHWLFIHPLQKSKIFYDSNSHIITYKDVAVLLLHSADDETVPIYLGRKLFKIGFHGRNEDGSKPIYMKEFGEGHGHKYICRSPDLLPLVQNFVSSI